MKALLALLGGATGLLFIGIIIAIALASILIIAVCILLFVKILKDKKSGLANGDSSNDTFLRMHQNFMDDSRRAHETHMNMHNNMFH